MDVAEVIGHGAASMPTTVMPAWWVALIPLVPLAGAIVLGLGGAALQRRFGKGPVGWIAAPPTPSTAAPASGSSGMNAT